MGGCRRSLLLLGFMAYYQWDIAERIHQRQELRKQSLRKQSLREMCANEEAFSEGKRDLDDMSNWELRNLILDDKHGIIYCYIHKVGCTSWKRVFFVLKQGEPYPDPMSIEGEMVHMPNMVPLLNSFPRTEMKAVIAGKFVSSWASSKGRVKTFFEDDEQLDKVLDFLTALVEAQTTRCHDQVAFVMDVLLPEATVHALSAVHQCSINRATDLYNCGVQYDLSEKQVLSHLLAKNMSKDAVKKMDTYAENLRRALDSEEFLKRL